MVSLTWLSRVGSSIVGATPLVGSLLGFLTLIYNVGESMVVGALNYATASIDAINTSAFGNATFAGITFIGYGNAVFPLEEAVSIWAAVGTACLSIALIRWIKSVIPTVSN